MLSAPSGPFKLKMSPHISNANDYLYNGLSEYLIIIIPWEVHPYCPGVCPAKSTFLIQRYIISQSQSKAFQAALIHFKMMCWWECHHIHRLLGLVLSGCCLKVRFSFWWRGCDFMCTHDGAILPEPQFINCNTFRYRGEFPWHNLHTHSSDWGWELMSWTTLNSEIMSFNSCAALVGPCLNHGD